MQASEKLFLQTVGRFVSERLKQWTAPLVERIEKIESALKGFGDGIDRATRSDLSAVDLEHLVDAKVARAFSALLDRPVVVSGHINRGGDLFFTLSDGNSFSVGRVVGQDADTPAIVAALKKQIADELAAWPRPKDGRDGFDLKNFSATFDGEHTITFAFVGSDGARIEQDIVLPNTLYRGVWRDGKFLQGDQVTHEGSMWVANCETSSRPGTLGDDWTLAVKRGRDGREGKPGQQGEPGKDGRDGRDLTQIGPDGKKW